MNYLREYQKCHFFIQVSSKTTKLIILVNNCGYILKYDLQNITQANIRFIAIILAGRYINVFFYTLVLNILPLCESQNKLIYLFRRDSFQAVHKSLFQMTRNSTGTEWFSVLFFNPFNWRFDREISLDNIQMIRCLVSGGNSQYSWAFR